MGRDSNVKHRMCRTVVFLAGETLANAKVDLGEHTQIDIHTYVEREIICAHT